MNLQGMPSHAASLIRQGGVAGILVVLAGLVYDSPTVVVIGLLTMILATYAAICTGNRSF
ncbi:hypothetical protein Pla108_33380 [Botrimarina colliarenosi]|uniref:Uncharacterized protein n=1 Tax=Botrimarina colliarenosi TaxID=2528001 RepID=A0A5C6A798_9BACT|nr:hypothetical protein [Botrimarina colliarenosi]TWT95195.1 hypothetical protein Pla108_33380 [Botrimarina colliarenosi]